MRPDYPIRSAALLSRGKQRAREILSTGSLLLEPGRSSGEDGGLILMYHRVLPETKRLPYPVQPGMYVTANTFERHLLWLGERYEIVALSGMVERLKEDERGRALCAITFDDGWRDTYSEAFPLLRKYRLPASVFLASGFVGTGKWFWPERTAFLVAAGSDRIGDDLVGAVDREIERLKTVSPEERERTLSELETGCRKRGLVPPEKPQTMTWEEAREMAEAGIEFGSHTSGHVILTEVDSAEAEKEIVDSRATIEQQLGREIRLFCYPNGDYTEPVRAMVQKAGYATAVTTTPGTVRADSDPWTLPRVGLHEDISRTRSQLELRLRRVAGLAAHRRTGGKR